MLPPDDSVPAANPGAALRTQIAAAEKRWRLEWLSRMLGRLGLLLAAVFTGWSLLTFVVPDTARHWPEGLILALGAVILVIGEGRLQPLDRLSIRRRIDRLLGLPDAVLTAAELQEIGPSPGGAAPPASAWIARQLEQTTSRLRGIDWRTAWPVRVPWWSGTAYALALLAVIFLGWRSEVVRAAERPPPPTARERDAARALRDVFNDWDQSQREHPDPELAKLLADLQPLREKLAGKDAALSEREAFTDLSRVEDKLAAIQARVDAQSLRPMAAEMAAALDKVDGLGALAAAVRRDDFPNAQAEAGRAAQQMAQPGAKLPPAAQANDAAGHFGQLAQKFGQAGNSGAGQSMSQMQTGLRRNQAAQVGEGLQNLQGSLATQNQRDSQNRDLKLQMKQMGVCKACLSDKESMCRGISLVPKLALMHSQKPGHGAGSETDPNRVGAPTELASDRNREHLEGVANEQGDTDTANLTTLDPNVEHVATRGAANFQAYEKLSQEAIADENLPLAHRQTIRRYFESIRPTGDKP
jgi:hypothetical protein